MCTTCGCSGTAGSSVNALGEHEHSHEHAHHPDHEHSHEHSHDHEHVADHASAHRHSSSGETLHGPPRPQVVTVEQKVLARNDLIAESNRAWLASRQVTALNLVSSPGSGKTTLLVRTIRELGEELSLSVIEGDQATTMDADRIRSAGCRVVQINTGAGCHLDANMLSGALESLDPPRRSTLFIENVGNLVCPALFDLGEAAKVLVASVTEGEDKPVKYPHMYRAANLLLLNKTDLLPHVAFDVERFLELVHCVNPCLTTLKISATRGDGLSEWYDWLRTRTVTGP